MSQPPFLRLPTELHCQVLNLLELHDRVKLASITCYFRENTKAPTHNELLDAEVGDWAKNRQLLTCKSCLQLRQFEDFADNMRKSRRCRGGAEAQTRFCIRCGVDKGWYSPGTHLTLNNLPHIVCRTCRTITETDLLGRCVVCPQTSRWAFLWPLASRNRIAEADYWSFTAKRCHDRHFSRDYYEPCPDV